MFESHRRQTQGPIITVNGVTHRSPEEMPAEAREIWDRFARQMEQQGVDWREQTRIDLSWLREGNVVRQSVNFERHSGGIQAWPHQVQSQPKPRFKAAFYVYLTCWGLLCFYGIAWRAPRLVLASESWLLLVAFVLFSAPWVLLTVNAARESARRQWEKDKARFASQGSLFGEPVEPKWELTGRMVAGLAGLMLVTYLAVFHGLAKLLHYTERKPGEVMATVTSKRTDLGRYAHCSPRLGFEEFRFTSDQLCVTDEFFRQVKIGDKIRITGQVSSYAVESDDLEVVSEEFARAKEVE